MWSLRERKEWILLYKKTEWDADNADDADKPPKKSV